MLYSRPITLLNDDTNDLQGLTDTHSVIGNTFTSLPISGKYMFALK